jgi:hypothetical protein
MALNVETPSSHNNHNKKTTSNKKPSNGLVLNVN